MNWNLGCFVIDCLILILLVTWMVLDRCNIYFHKGPNLEPNGRH